MINKYTYHIVILFLLFGVPQSVLGDSSDSRLAQQSVVNENTDISSLLDRIYSVNRTDLKEAKRLSDEAFALLHKKPDKNLQARLLNLTAYRKILSMELDASLKDVLEARRHAIEVNNQEEEATSYRLEGVIYTVLGDYSEGVSLFFRALALQESLSSDDTYSTLQNISIAYNEMGDYVNYLKYGYILLEHPTSVPGSLEEGIAYGTIGSTLIELGDYSKAREMLVKAEVIFKDQNVLYVSTVHFLLADIDYRSGNYQRALTIINDTISLAQKQGYNVNFSSSLPLKVKILTKMGNTSEALKTLDDLVNYAVAKKDPKAKQEAYEQFALIYESQGKYQEALEAHQKFKQITDELFNDRSATKIALEQTRFEMEQKEQRIALLEAQNSLENDHHIQLGQVATLRGYLIVLVILMLLGLLLVLLRNVRTRRVLEKNSDKLKEARRQAEDANNSKSTFLASMSHDLRTPLNAILGYSEAIQLEINGPLGNARYQDYIGSINKSGKLLLELIDDVLDLSKVEAGKYELSEREISLPTVIMRTLEMIRPVAQEKGITIECDYPEDFPKLLADERIIVQVLNNLISNSLKFTLRGGTISLSGGYDNDGGINITITDNGIGLTEAELIKAIRPFEQIDPEVTQGSGGTGLGLTLCIKYMELHGGQLEMTSEKNVGTTTVLYFPAERIVK